MTDKPSECEALVTYTVNNDGISDKSRAEYDRLQEALRNGARVVDFAVTPTQQGGSATAAGCVCITVLLDVRPGKTKPVYVGPG